MWRESCAHLAGEFEESGVYFPFSLARFRNLLVLVPIADLKRCFS
jgi:hypothetical protein